MSIEVDDDPNDTFTTALALASTLSFNDDADDEIMSAFDTQDATTSSIVAPQDALTSSVACPTKKKRITKTGTSRKKSAHMDSEDILLLCSSWVKTTKNCNTGTNQKADTFWNEVTRAY